jgi:hypothetical protein
MFGVVLGSSMFAYCSRLPNLGLVSGEEALADASLRILSPFDGHSPNATTHDQVVFTDVSAVKASWSGLVSTHKSLIFLVSLTHELQLPKLKVASSIPVARSSFPEQFLRVVFKC